MSTPRDVVVLGSTGSIGTQALDLVRANPDRFRVVGLTAGGSQPRAVRRSRWRSSRRRTHGLGEDASRRGRRPRRATSCSTASPAPSGCGPTLAALDAGNTLALANKESLIMGGPLVARAREARARSCRSTPSTPRSPSACAAAPPDEVRRLVLTASGGPFRGRTRDELADVTVERGAGPPDLGHGPGRHHQLRDPGQQGPRGDRGAPALRHPLRPDRGRGAPDQRGALDGRVRRRLDARAGQPADDADPDRARPGLARPGARRRAAGRLDAGRDLGVLPARRRGVPGGRAGPARRGSAAAPRRPSTTPPTRSCVEAFRAGPAARSPRSSTTVADVLGRARRTLGGSSSPSTTSSPPTPGPATQAARRDRRDAR